MMSPKLSYVSLLDTVCREFDVDAMFITAQDVSECFKSIKLGKAADLNGLAAEHFVFSHTIICVLHLQCNLLLFQY